MSHNLLLIGTLVSLASAQDWDAEVLRKLKVIEAAADKQVPTIRIEALLDAAAPVKDTHPEVSQSLAAKAVAAWHEGPGVPPTGRIAGRLFRLQGPGADQIVGRGAGPRPDPATEPPETRSWEADDIIRTAVSMVESAPAGVDRFEAANALSGTAVAKLLMDSLASLISQEAEVIREYRKRGQAGLSR